jgi:carbamoyl-phosphate synthase large subunit
MNILINGVGGPTPRSISRALRWYSRYRRYELIGTDINPLARDLYDTALYNKTYVVPPAGHPDYWNVMEDLVEKHQIEMALIQPELEVMAWAKQAKTGRLPCKALLPDYDLASILVDKARMTELLDGHGLVPESVVLDINNGGIDQLEAALAYPFWIRSTTGSSGLGALKVTNREALQNWIAINPDVKQFIASAYLSGRNLACKLLYYEGQLMRAACGERVNYIMSKTAPSGITGNTSFGRLLNDPQLVQVATRAMDALFEAVKAPKHGFFTLDFKEDDAGRPYITEVNVRHVAFSICFAAAGATFAEDTVRLLDDDPTFDRQFRMYEFEPNLIFLRDVDARPIIMKESQLLRS